MLASPSITEIAMPPNAVRAAIEDPGVRERLLNTARATLLKCTRSAEHADDAVQTAMARAWEKKDTFDLAKASIYTWLTGVLLNVLKEKVRELRKQPAALTTDQVEDRRGDSNAIPAEVELQQVLLRLPAAERELLELKLREWSCDRIAAHLGISSANVRIRIYRAKKLAFALVREGLS